VFEAQVQSREVLTQPDGQPRFELELAVAAWFKGDGGKTVTLHTSSPCALPAQVRQRWIIYATESEDRLRASLCSRSTRDVDTERKHLPDPFETWQLPAPPVTAHSAAEECDPASLEAIVSSGEPIHGGIQPFATCTDAQLPAMVAVMGQHKQAHHELSQTVTRGDHAHLERLLSAGLDPNQRPEHPVLRIAFERSDERSVELLRAHGAEVTPIALRGVLTSGHPPFVPLIKEGDWTPEQLSTMLGADGTDLELASWMFTQGATMEGAGERSFARAIAMNRLDYALLIASHGALVTERSVASLARKAPERVGELLEQVPPGSVSLADIYCRVGSDPVVAKALRDAGMSDNAITNDGRSVQDCRGVRPGR